MASGGAGRGHRGVGQPGPPGSDEVPSPWPERAFGYSSILKQTGACFHRVRIELSTRNVLHPTCLHSEGCSVCAHRNSTLEISWQSEREREIEGGVGGEEEERERYAVNISLVCNHTLHVYMYRYIWMASLEPRPSTQFYLQTARRPGFEANGWLC